MTHRNYSNILLLILLLILTPLSVSATTSIIPRGGEIFLGEEGLDIRAAVPPPYDAIAFFPAGSSLLEMPLDVRKIETRSFSASPSLYMDRLGTWYQWDSRRGVAGSPAFIIREPRATVRILQQATMEDISSGTVSRGAALYFQVDTNTGTVASRPGFNPASDGLMDLLITTPGGGILTGVETRNAGMFSLSRITLQDSLQTIPPALTGGWDTGATGSAGSYLYAGGTYTVTPRFSFNRIDENLRQIGREFTRPAMVTLGSEKTTVTARDERVIRGNSLSVTITGTPSEPVYIWMDAGSRSGAPGDQPPMILFAQEGVQQDNPGGPYLIGSYRPVSEGGRSIRDLVPPQPYEGVKYYAMVTPDRYGRRTIELRTSGQTDDARYTLKIESASPAGTRFTDEISFSVVKGSVSLATGKDVYAIGEEVKLSGYNTESCDTYLFITGPNLPSHGGRLDQPRQAVRTGDPSSFTIASGDCETWEYRLYTGELGIDAGTYTIYAVPSPVDRYDLGSVPYQTIPLTLRRPYVSVSNRDETVARGDTLTLTGYSAGASGSDVAVWIFGRNFFRYDVAGVDRDGSFEYEIPSWMTDDMVAGEYVVIIQHPMSNGEFDLWPDGQRQLVLGIYPYPGSPVFRVAGPGSLKGSDAANALVTALNSPFIDDTYTRYDIRVTSPRITIDPSSLRQETGYPVIIEGTTNLAAGKRLLVEVSDNRFMPTSKSDRLDSFGYSGTTEIWQGEGNRFFSFTIPAGRLAEGEYRVLVQATESDAMTTDLLVIAPPPVIQEVTVAPETNGTAENTTSQQNATANLTPETTPSLVSATTTLTPAIPTPFQAPPAQSLPDDERLFPMGIGVAVGLLIAGLVAVIVSLLKYRRPEKEQVGDESQAGDDSVNSGDQTGAEAEEKAEDDPGSKSVYESGDEE